MADNSYPLTSPSSTTRICIKNLPPKVTQDDQLKQFLAKHHPNAKTCVITDCRILRKPNGKSRRIAFCGFKTAAMAEQALQLDRSFFTTYRLSVQLATGVGGEQPSKNDHTETDAQLEATDPHKSHQPLSSTHHPKFWANDDEEIIAKDEPVPKDESQISDMDFLRSKQSKKEDLEEDNSKSQQEPALQTDRLFCRNLPFATTEQELTNHFQSYKITEAHIPVDDQKRSKGFAFLTFPSLQLATAALEACDRQPFQGRLLHLLPARRPATEHDGVQNLSFKQKQQKNKQKQTQGWSASFIRGDAVLDNMADRLKSTKGEILNVQDLSGGDAAVRMALGETHILQENRDFFSKHGIDLEGLLTTDHPPNETKPRRSSTNILVKNLPFDTSLDELQPLFPDASRILLPPSRTIALVKYDHAADAKRAFRRTSYRRFKHVPLYLEWAPLSIKTKRDDKAVAKEHTVESRTAQDTDEDGHEDQESGGILDDGGVSEAVATIHVKNLNFSTTEESLKKTFQDRCGGVRAVRIPTKTVPMKKVGGKGEGSKVLSMGFGFVEYGSLEKAQKAMKTLQGVLLDGHRLELKHSKHKTLSQPPLLLSPDQKKPTKVMVRNVPFQATRKELLQLFGSFGELKKVRLPKKMDGKPRGFAFVEFISHKQAVAAIKALGQTHLYGRHLVLEWASTDDESSLNVEKLREKASQDAKSALRPNKRIKF